MHRLNILFAWVLSVALSPQVASADSAKSVQPGATPSSRDDRIQFAVDTCAELLSIVFRLAVGEEFAFVNARHYDADVDAYFKPFVKHAAIAATAGYP